MINKSTPTIELSGTRYDFKELLGVSLLERNVKFLSYYGFKAVNFKCKLDEVEHLNSFITNNFLLGKEGLSFSINSIEHSEINIYANYVYNYNQIELDTESNVLESIDNRNIAAITNEKTMREASMTLYMLIDKVRAEKVFIFTNYVNRPIGKLLTLFLLHFKITPNSISFIALFIAIMGSLLVSSGNYFSSILGILLFQFSASLDCADGQVARLKYLGSSFGGWLDSIFDKIVKFIFYVAIGAGLYNVNNDSIYLYMSIALLFGNSMTHIVDFTYKMQFKPQLKESGLINNKTVIRNILNSDLNILGFACVAIALNVQVFYLIALAIYFNFLWIVKIYKKYLSNLNN